MDNGIYDVMAALTHDITLRVTGALEELAPMSCPNKDASVDVMISPL